MTRAERETIKAAQFKLSSAIGLMPTFDARNEPQPRIVPSAAVARREALSAWKLLDVLLRDELVARGRREHAA